MTLAENKIPSSRDISPISTLVADHVGRVVIKHQHGRHGIDETIQLVDEVLTGFDADPEVHVVVLRAPTPTIPMQDDPAEPAYANHQTVAAITRRLTAMTTPTISVIEGPCRGAALTLALATDIRIAVEHSTFALDGAFYGYAYSVDEIETLVAAVGPVIAADVLYTARCLTAREAVDMRLINRMATVDELDEVVAATAHMVAMNDPSALRAAKASVQAATRRTDVIARDIAEQRIRQCDRSRSIREAQQAQVRGSSTSLGQAGM
jgi:enoyl-CoA hydratase/carnithine racemase